jgi:S1-C subfamily serine protease
MKTLTSLALSATLLLGGCGLFANLNQQAPPPVAEPPRVTVNDVLRNTVALVGADGIFCSGVAVQGIILTAYHCVDSGKAFEIFFDGKPYKGVPVLGWETYDLAIVDAVGAQMKDTLEVSPWEPEYGMKIVWTGFPLGDPTKRVFHGIVAAPQNVEVPAYFDIDGQVIPGNSGGPVVDEKGRLIGIVSATSLFLFGVPQIVDIGHAVRPEYIRKILNN